MPTTSVLAASDDDGSDQKSGTPKKIWIPILIIGITITVVAIVLCWKRWGSVRVRIRFWLTNTATSAPRELTAEELAGTINGTNLTSGSATNRTRRIRRTRRTPSQISTTSLPAYAKEPGEQELVITRGPEGMEDTGMPPATVVMEPVSEDGEDSMHSRNNSHSSQYPPIPASLVDAPLLDRSDSSNELTAQPVRPPGDIMVRPSIDTLPSSEEGTSLAPLYDDRGEAPAYTETVDNIGPTMNNELPPSPVPVLPRRSGFRTLLHSIPNRLSMHSSFHTRVNSSLSMMSSENPHGTCETSQSRASHRPSNSASGSLLSLTHFRNLSRQSNHKLNSPSLISLNSISAPLTHTLTRTEFTYPKSGPTPEQLRLISSPESFTRFAVPYGPDAIAYASRQDLNDVPPPDFDAPTYESAGPSRLRTSNSVADMVSLEESSASTPQQEASIESILAADFPAPVSLSPGTSVTPSSPQENEFSGVSPLQIPLPSSPATSENGFQLQLEFESLVLPKPSTIASGAPPTAYRVPSTLEDIPQSRASSVASFATAIETIVRPSSRFSASPSPGDDTEDEAETPTTPNIGRNHVSKPLDMTTKRAHSLTAAVTTGSSH
ncbi:hypothetical protein E4T56_gene10195 [Termitomyces sp. T112]|nr:hypothetical protein E4T56_gene10195 [Termitomyces sp. T112]